MLQIISYISTENCGLDTQLTANVIGSGYKYEWFGPAVQPTSVPNVINIGSYGSYSVIINDGQSSAELSISPVPSMPAITSNISNYDNIYQNDYVILTATDPNSDIYSWFADSNQTEIVSYDQSIILNTNKLGLTTYYVVAKNNQFCQSVPNQININIKSRSVIIPSNPTITNKSSITFVASYSSTYQWFLDQQPIPDATSQTFTTNIPGSYSVNDSLASVLNYYPDPPKPIISFLNHKLFVLNPDPTIMYEWSTGSTNTNIIPDDNISEYYVVATNNYGSESKSDIFNYVKPSDLFIEGNLTLCHQSKLNIKVVGSDNLYKWQYLNNYIRGTGSVITYDETGPNLILDNYLGGLYQVASSNSSLYFIVTIKPNPIIYIDAIHQNNKYILKVINADPDSLFLWSDGSTTQSIVVDHHNYTVNVSSPLGCHQTIKYEPSFKKINTILQSPNIHSYKLDNHIILYSDTNNLNYKWFGNNKIISESSMIIINHDLTIYDLVVTDCYGSSSSAQTYMHNKPSQSVITSNKKSICLGDYVELSASEKPYRWSTLDYTKIIKVKPKYINNYTVNNSDNFDILVNPKPSVCIIGELIIEQGLATKLTAQTSIPDLTDSEFNWFDANNNIISTEPSIEVSPQSTTTYSVMVKNLITGCVTKSNMVIVTVCPKQNILTVPKIAQPNITVQSNKICKNSSRTITYSDYNAVDNYAFQWFHNSILIPGANDPEYIATQPGLYQMQISNHVSFSKSNIINLELSELEAHIMCNNTNISPNTSIILRANYIPYTQYLWSNQNVTRNIVVQPQTDTEYTVTVLDNNDCKITSEPVNIKIYQDPIIDLEYDNNSVQTIFDPDYKYEWFNVNISKPVSLTNFYEIVESGYYYVRVQHKLTNVDKLSDIVHIKKVHEIPNIIINVKYSKKHNKYHLFMVNDHDPNYKYQWFDSDGLILKKTDQELFINNFNTYYLRVSMNNYFVNSQKITIMSGHPYILIDDDFKQIFYSDHYILTKPTTITIKLFCECDSKIKWYGPDNKVKSNEEKIKLDLDSIRGTYRVEIKSKSGKIICTVHID